MAGERPGKSTLDDDGYEDDDEDDEEGVQQQLQRLLQAQLKKKRGISQDLALVTTSMTCMILMY
jgi:hypothetical protein